MGYEEKLHLVEKFLRTKEMVTEINRLALQFKEEGDIKKIEKIQRISQQIIKDF